MPLTGSFCLRLEALCTPDKPNAPHIRPLWHPAVLKKTKQPTYTLPKSSRSDVLPPPDGALEDKAVAARDFALARFRFDAALGLGAVHPFGKRVPLAHFTGLWRRLTRLMKVATSIKPRT